ncbi:FAD-binding oxidoreductase [Phytoactinopolyspora endophytica]|uniref:FAD-binding oxidoreductase n=1 Tax=Phytoactinopolyspora endophytica TaxID=1642495 RepID=UPI00101BEAD7|nr:FAD-binding oxidoreductase [Phytoactinopolyspora endophytica]
MDDTDIRTLFGAEGPDGSSGIDDLARMLQGPVLTPGQDGYDDERSGFSLAAQHRPDIIVGAAGPADVQAAVAYARRNGLPVAVQATGHGAPEPATAGMLITTGRMAGVEVKPEAGSAWIEAGVRWQQVIEAAAPFGLAPISGSSPHVGAVSYTLGGGIGLLGRTFGYAADYVRRIDVVTADGRLRHVTEESEPDLFWALRGGRSNFGVVTGMEIELVQVSRIFGGGLYFDADDVPDVLRVWRDWTTTVPDEMTSSVAVIPGRNVVQVRIAYVGDMADGERLIAPLRDAGPRLIDMVTEMSYTESESICNDPTDPQASTMVNAMLSDLDDAPIAALRDVSRGDATVPCILDIRHLGGALSRPPAVPNAVGHRDAQYLVGVITPLTGTDVKVARDVHGHVLKLLQPWTVGRYVNFLAGEHATRDEIRAAYEPTDYQRLSVLKGVYDPSNLFRLNHNIPPALDS